MRGIIQGSLWGLVLGGLGLGMVSLIAPLPQGMQAPQVPQLSAPVLEPVSPIASALIPMAAPQPHVGLAAPAQAVAPAPEPTLPDVQTESAAAPDASDVATNLAAPDDGLAPDPIPATQAPRAPSGVSVLEPAANTEDPVAILTKPAAQVEPIPAPVIVAEDPATDIAVATPAAPVVLPAPQLSALPEPLGSAVDRTPVQEVTDAPQQPPSNAATVRVNRPDATPADIPEQDATGTDALPDDAPALKRYAAAFENPADLPVIAVVLVDTGAMDDPMSALSGLGFGPTIALNALAENAADKMASYRAAGLEIALQAELPIGAQPTDVEVAFEAAFTLLTESAMLFSDGSGVLQSDHTVAQQVMQVLAADGRGFVTVQQGLGNAARIAGQADVATATILRDVDGADEDAAEIARSLDQAAFRARQSGSAIVMGRMTPLTLIALRDWAAEVDQSQLAIAPVSAILLGSSD